MSGSVQPHRRQPTRLPRPWDSPGKNTGVGCHFLLQFMKVKSESEVSQLYPTLSDPMDCSLPGSSVHRIFQARVPEQGAIGFSDVIFYRMHVSGWPKSSFRSSCNILWKNPDKFFGEPNTWHYLTAAAEDFRLSEVLKVTWSMLFLSVCGSGVGHFGSLGSRCGQHPSG